MRASDGSTPRSAVRVAETCGRRGSKPSRSTAIVRTFCGASSCGPSALYFTERSVRRNRCWPLLVRRRRPICFLFCLTTRIERRIVILLRVLRLGSGEWLLQSLLGSSLRIRPAVTHGQRSAVLVQCLVSL